MNAYLVLYFFYNINLGFHTHRTLGLIIKMFRQLLTPHFSFYINTSLCYSNSRSFSFASWQIKPSMFWKVDAPRCTCIALRAIWKSKTCKQCDAYISRFCVCQKHHHRTKVWHWLCMFLVQEKRNDIFEFQELFWPFYSVPSISLPTAGWFPPRRTT